MSHTLKSKEIRLFGGNNHTGTVLAYYYEEKVSDDKVTLNEVVYVEIVRGKLNGIGKRLRINSLRKALNISSTRESTISFNPYRRLGRTYYTSGTIKFNLFVGCPLGPIVGSRAQARNSLNMKFQVKALTTRLLITFNKTSKTGLSFVKDKNFKYKWINNKWESSLEKIDTLKKSVLCNTSNDIRYPEIFHWGQLSHPVPKPVAGIQEDNDQRFFIGFVKDSDSTGKDEVFFLQVTYFNTIWPLESEDSPNPSFWPFLSEWNNAKNHLVAVQLPIRPRLPEDELKKEFPSRWAVDYGWQTNEEDPFRIWNRELVQPAVDGLTFLKVRESGSFLPLLSHIDGSFVWKLQYVITDRKPSAERIKNAYYEAEYYGCRSELKENTRSLKVRADFPGIRSHKDDPLSTVLLLKPIPASNYRERTPEYRERRVLNKEEVFKVGFVWSKAAVPQLDAGDQVVRIGSLDLFLVKSLLVRMTTMR